MAFESLYRRKIEDNWLRGSGDSKRWSDLNQIFDKQKKLGEVPSGDSTILPFFGFKCDTDTDSHITGIIPAKYELRRSYTDTLEIHKIPGQFTGAVHYYEIFSRLEDQSSPTLKKLENEFVALLEKKRIDVWDSEYIYRDLESYYNRKLTRPDDDGRTTEKMGVIGCLVPTLFIPMWLGIFARAIISLFASDEQIPLVQRSEKYINKLRKKYYKTMERAYGKKMGALLKEYSITRAKENGKIY